jgi:hypothetical protein
MLELTLIGLGATFFIDIWALWLRRAFQVRSLDYCLLGRWILHMPRGIIVHESIAAARSLPRECVAGWGAHYTIGVAFALCFGFLAPEGWLQRPTLLPALTFGIATVVVPFFTLQPAFGLGVAASRTPNPSLARLKSLTTHAVFGAGLFAWAYLFSRLR